MKDGFYFMPAGGSDEIGMNLNFFGVVLEGKEYWIIVDMGVSIGKNLGIRLKMPSINFALDRNILAVVCTHGHDDHIGAIPYLMPLFGRKIPVIATPFTMGLIEEKLKSSDVTGVELRTVQMNSKFEIGPFTIELIYVTHSILEPNMLLIKMHGDNGKTISLLHTGDWKFDSDPILGGVTDYDRIRLLGDKNIDYLICDSTNGLVEEYTKPEGLAKENLEKLIAEYKNKRIIISCFASNVARFAGIIESARKYGRKVALVGRSLLRVYSVALKMGYLLDTEDVMVPSDKINTIQDDKIIIVCTGSQGEREAVLNRLANETCRFFKIKEGDLVIFSSRVIPGNGPDIDEIKNTFIRRGINIIDTSTHEVHVSGHPSRPEIRELFDLARPNWVIPVHGDALHLNGVRDVAMESNIPALVPFNGSVIHLGVCSDGGKPEIIDKIDIPKMGVDGKQIISLDTHLLKTRRHLSEEGTIFISFFNMDNIDISTCGVLPSSILSDINYKSKIYRIIKKAAGRNGENDSLSKIISNEVSNFIQYQYGKKPLVVTHVAKI